MVEHIHSIKPGCVPFVVGGNIYTLNVDRLCAAVKAVAEKLMEFIEAVRPLVEKIQEFLARLKPREQERKGWLRKRIKFAPGRAKEAQPHKVDYG